MDARRIRQVYGHQPWIYTLLLKATATKFTRWKALLKSQCPDETDDVAEAMTRYARDLCCPEIATAASHLHDVCQDGSIPIDKAINQLLSAIQRLDDLSKLTPPP